MDPDDVVDGIRRLQNEHSMPHHHVSGTHTAGDFVDPEDEPIPEQDEDNGEDHDANGDDDRDSYHRGL